MSAQILCSVAAGDEPFRKHWEDNYEQQRVEAGVQQEETVHDLKIHDPTLVILNRAIIDFFNHLIKRHHASIW